MKPNENSPDLVVESTIPFEKATEAVEKVGSSKKRKHNEMSNDGNDDDEFSDISKAQKRRKISGEEQGPSSSVSPDGAQSQD